MRNAKTKTSSHSEDNIMSEVMALMDCNVFLKTPKYWLDLGSRSANGVFGSSKYGIPTGKISELAGPKHSGKSAETMWEAGQAQTQFDAFVIWVDLENSLENESSKKGIFINRWANKLGLNTSPRSFYRVYPKILKLKKTRKKGKRILKKGTAVIQSAEYLMKEVETVAHLIKAKYEKRPLYIAIDSLANLQTEEAVMAGFEGGNMRIGLSRATFLAMALPRIQTLAANYAIWVRILNHLRNNPAQLFGDSRYAPGGSAKEHNTHAQVWITSRNKLREEDPETGNLISIAGKLENIKNKMGGKSLQGKKCSYTIRFRKKEPSNIFRFGPLIK